LKASGNVETNFPVSKITEYATTWSNADFNDIKTFSLPGKAVDSGIFYFIVDYEELNSLTEQFLM